MTTRREALMSRLKGALRASVVEVRKDPSLLGKVVNSVCTEMGMDPLASGYVANKAQNAVKEKPDAS